MNMKRLPLTLLLCVATVGTAVCQEHAPTRTLLLGPSAGFTYGINSGDVPVYGGIADCGLFSGGSTLASSLGGTLSLPSFLSSRFGLIGSLRFAFSSGRMTASPLVPFRIPDPESGQLVELKEEYRLDAVSLESSIDLLAALHMSDRLTVALGPFLGYRISSTISQTEYVLEPEDFRLANGHREQPMVDGSNPRVARFSFGPYLWAGYRLPFGKDRYIVPGISFQADLLSSLQDYSWRTYRAGVNVSLLFNASSSSAPPPPEDTVAYVPRLTASVEMFGVDEEDNPLPSARIQVYETLFQRHAPLLPAVFFDKGLDVLPKRYAELNAEEAGAFATDELAGLNVLEVQHYALNVIGTRLQEQTGSEIALVGAVSKDEPAALARRRAEQIRSYLTKVWEIDSSRVRLADGIMVMQRSNEETEDGRGDNRRVEMASDDLSILAPVVTTQLIRDFDPPLIRMKPEFDAEAGVKEWSLVISQGGNEVARYGSNLDQPDSSNMTWRILHDRVDSALSPIIATLIVEDSTGAVVTDKAVLPLSMVRNPRVVNERIERSGDRERLAYTLVGFDFSSSGLGVQNREVVLDIAEVVKNGAEIEVTGYTDRIGDQARNRELALERAMNVATILQQLLEQRDVVDVVLNVSGEGAESEIFDNDLPEGRLLSRGVGIVVEQESGEP